MVPIYPPHGPQDMERFRRLKREERAYLQFALEFYSFILVKRPGQPEALEMAANHFTSLGYYTDGLLVDQRLAQIKPQDPNVMYNLGCSFALIGRLDDAMETLAKAVLNGYDDYKHMTEDNDLAALRHDPRFHDLVFSMKAMLADEE